MSEKLEQNKHDDQELKEIIKEEKGDNHHCAHSLSTQYSFDNII